MVFYPISHPDPQTGLTMINWIAEVTMDNAEGWKQSGWFRPVSIDEFQHHFADWIWDWLDVPALIRQADTVFENPMIDRDPVPTWQDGAVALLGDAAHAMYPTGSNGGSQAIVDARVLGAASSSTASRRRRLRPSTKSCAARSRSWSCAIAAPGRSGCSTWSMTLRRTFDNIDDVIPPGSAPNSWRATRRRPASRSKS